MYKILDNVSTYNPKYGFVSKLNKGEVKQYDCFTWIYRINEMDNADKSIDIIVFCFEGANAPLEENISYLELERCYLNEQARVVNNAYKALKVACDMFKIAGIEHKTIIDEVIYQYNDYENENNEEEWEEDE